MKVRAGESYGGMSGEKSRSGERQESVTSD